MDEGADVWTDGQMGFEYRSVKGGNTALPALPLLDPSASITPSGEIKHRYLSGVASPDVCFLEFTDGIDVIDGEEGGGEWMYE